jgi:polar amino acid transport system substrate-binding protein
VAVRRPALRAFAACLGAGALVLAGCAHNTEDTGAPAVSTSPVSEQKVDAIAALLPANLRNSGKITAGVNLPYPPNEFKDSSGKIVGFEIDLFDAVAQVLGLRPDLAESSFERIIPSIQAGTYDVGASSFTDTLERQKSVDFVDFFNAGVQWSQQAGRPAVDPDNACGMKVAVQSTTVEDTDDVPRRSAACVAAGKPPITKVAFDDQTAATNALMVGQVEAMSADYTVTVAAVKQSGGKLALAGSMFDAAPYGWPVAKGSSLGPALERALQHIIDDGDYKRICGAWGVSAGMIAKPALNGATS